MTLLLRDSIDAPLIPQDTPVVAGYGDGLYQWSPAWKASGGFPQGANWWDLFPNSVKLVIVVNAQHEGDVLDVERGDATPADVPGWCDRFHRPGRRAPTIYCDRDTWPLVQQAAGARRVDYWIGTLDGTRSLPGAVAVQYVDTGAYDESEIADPSWVGLEEHMAFSDGFLVGLSHVTLKAVYQREPTTQEMFDFKNTLNADLSNFADLVQGAAAQLLNPDAARIQSETLAAQLDQLKLSPVAPHTHPVSVSGTSGAPA